MSSAAIVRELLVRLDHPHEAVGEVRKQLLAALSPLVQEVSSSLPSFYHDRVLECVLEDLIGQDFNRCDSSDATLNGRIESRVKSFESAWGATLRSLDARTVEDLLDSSKVKELIGASARRAGNDPDTVDDAKADLCAHLWNQLGKFDPEHGDPFVNWVSRVISNKAVDLRRRQAEIHKHDESLTRWTERGWGEEEVVDQNLYTNPEEATMHRARVEAITSCLEELAKGDDEALEVLWEAFVLELHQREIAQRHDLSSEDVVSKRKQRAKAKLTRCLERKGWGP